MLTREVLDVYRAEMPEATHAAVERSMGLLAIKAWGRFEDMRDQGRFKVRVLGVKIVDLSGVARELLEQIFGPQPEDWHT